MAPRMAPRQARAESKSPSLSPSSSEESDSDFPSSILPTSSPTKSTTPSQAAVAVKPMPGSPEFQALGPVTVSDKEQKIASVSRKLSFGHLEERASEITLSPPAELYHDKRARKPSEKAAYMAQHESEVTPKAKRDSKNRKAKPEQETRDNTSSDPEILSVDSDVPLQQNPIPTSVKKRKQAVHSPTIEISNATQKNAVGTGKEKPAKKRLRLVPQSPKAAVDSKTGKGKGKAVQETREDPASDAEHLSNNSDIPAAHMKSPVKKRKQGVRSPSLEIVNPPQKEIPAKKRLRLVPQSPKPPPAFPLVDSIIVNDTPATPVKDKRLSLVPQSPDVPSQSGDDGGSHNGDTIIEDEVHEDGVVEKEPSNDIKKDVAYEEVSDKLLRKAYLNLPHFPPCELLPFASSSAGQYSGSSPDLALLGYSPLLSVLKSPQLRNFANAVNFLGSGQIINPTRDSTTAVIKDSDRLVIPGSKRPAVLITTGVVFNCNLWEPVQSQRDRVRKIQVVPLAYEYERLLGWVGSIYGKRQLYGNVTPDLALGFVTKKEGSSQGPPFTSPKKQSKFFVTAKPPASSSGQAPPPIYPAFRTFEDTIPIYDARAQRFRFDEDAFNNLNNLPTLDRDLPQNSIAAVGYTCNTFPYAAHLPAPKNDTAVSFNVQFVILLGELPE